jgi:HD-GYP domain-containing protein (c-di-GMP phosphodiesterase class II)
MRKGTQFMTELVHSSRSERQAGYHPAAGDNLEETLILALEQVRRRQVEWEQLTAELAETRAKLEDANQTNAQLAVKFQAAQVQAEQARERALQERARADRLASAMRGIHEALFDGNIYSLILKACMNLTGATRGLYVTTRGVGDRLRVRAAVDVDGYPHAEPSEFIAALCHKVLEENETFVCNARGDLKGLPRPASAAEDFGDCVVAPAVLLRNLSGVVIVADKTHGEFDEDDIDFLVSIGNHAAVAVENMQLQSELRNAYLAIVSALADAAEAKDPYTQGHCELVATLARLTAEELALSDFERGIVCYAALLHDIGKIGVSDGILNKPGALLPAEREVVRGHVTIGHNLIAKIPSLELIAQAVLYHHEWYDGTGYPHGLQGEEIPVPARIVSVVDAYCAMITKRSYKEPFSEEQARAELKRFAGTQFDPAIVKAFLKVLDSPYHHEWNGDQIAECGVLPGYGRRIMDA